MSRNTKQRQQPAYSSPFKAGRHAGVGLHFSSLPGPHGIGDIADTAMPFIDWLERAGLGVWQFLPTGPTAFGDSPYQPLSAFAGNPMLIGLDPLVRLGLLKPSELEVLHQLPPDKVDFSRLIPLKTALLTRAADQFQARKSPQLRSAYETFLHEVDEKWLHEYAQYRVIKTLHDEQAWPQWGKPYRRRNSAVLKKLLSEQRAALERIKFTQFLFAHQWRELHQYAGENSVSLFGDMPIYLALDSADAWSQPEMLQLDAKGQPQSVAGVPPDYFSEEGQLWGNPLYDWTYHKQTGYQWWIERLRQATSQCDLIRIDHFRGFESYWSVPSGAKTARKGSWLAGPGDALFDALHQSLGQLPIVAEDLGVITPEVDALREGHGIPGMRVLQFDISEPEFDVNDIEINCVCYTGTHDNDTTVGWFAGDQNDDRDLEEILLRQERALQVSGGTAASIHRDMIKLAFSSPAVLAVAPMQDYLGLGSEARLNTPGSAAQNWQWRVRKSDVNDELAEQITQMIDDSNRRGRAI